MLHKLLAVAIPFAILSIWVSSASAVIVTVYDNFYSDEASTELVGGQVGEHEFVTNTGVVVCEVAHFTGELAEHESETIILQPAYTECEFQELFGITVSTNGCGYEFSITEGANGDTSIVECNSSVPYVQMGSLATCRVRFEEQSGKDSIEYDEIGFSLEILTMVEGLSYSESGLFCSGGEVENGTYNGLTVLSGYGEFTANLGVGPVVIWDFP